MGNSPRFWTKNSRKKETNEIWRRHNIDLSLHRIIHGDEILSESHPSVVWKHHSLCRYQMMKKNQNDTVWVGKKITFRFRFSGVFTICVFLELLRSDVLIKDLSNMPGFPAKRK